MSLSSLRFGAIYSVPFNPKAPYRAPNMPGVIVKSPQGKAFLTGETAKAYQTLDVFQQQLAPFQHSVIDRAIVKQPDGMTAHWVEQLAPLMRILEQSPELTRATQTLLDAVTPKHLPHHNGRKAAEKPVSSHNPNDSVLDKPFVI